MVETKTSSNEILSSEQKRNGFHTKYLSICKAKNVAPLPEVKIKQKNFHVLDFHADRVKVTDWMAICEALHNDMTLKFIAIRLRRNNEKILESKDTSKKAKAVDTHPVVYTNFVLTHLIEALENVLTKNSLLETLVVEGLPLMGRYLATFVKGLVQNKSLTSINFSRSKIGDEGCTSLCNTIKHSMNIKCVNFSSCNLSAKGAEAIADLIKFQKIQRFSEAWAQSLRYREADPDSFSGVRKISLNNNPQVGHVGLETITEILQEDVWIKDVEMQNCGLTDDSAQSIISCLNLNKTILNFNIAGNSDISEHFYRHIFMSLGNSESENSDSTDSNGSSAKKVTKKDLMKNVKFLEEQLEVSIIAKKKTETLAEMLQKQFNEVQRDALIQGAFKIPEGFHLISHESLDDLMKRAEKSKKESILLKRQKKKLKSLTPRKVKSLLFAKAPKKAQKASKSEVLLRGKYQAVHEKVFIEDNIGDHESPRAETPATLTNEKIMTAADLMAMFSMRKKKLIQEVPSMPGNFDPRSLFTNSPKLVPQNSDADSSDD